MKLGLITDIHENVPALHAALEVCRRSKVDQVIVIGDLFEDGGRIEETCRLLTAAQAIGVWGNHDFGLSYCPDPSDIENYSAVVKNFFAALKPNMGIADCHFSHCEPWQDATTLDGMWYFEGAPDRHGNLARIFDAVPHRLIFFGHFHKWLLMQPQGLHPWDGKSPVDLSQGRYAMVVAPLCKGHFGVLDTDSWLLEPMRVAYEAA
jgi:predicted phosphodiesterase